MTMAYDPANQYEIKVWDVEFRRDPVRTLMARIYQPQGEGPFPALLDLHGGAWNNQNRTSNSSMDERLAASGILVVAIDLRLAPEAPYPASVQDANYGIRWSRPRRPNGRVTRLLSARWAAPAAVTSSNCVPCARTTRATAPFLWSMRLASTRH